MPSHPFQPASRFALVLASALVGAGCTPSDSNGGPAPVAPAAVQPAPQPDTPANPRWETEQADLVSAGLGLDGLKAPAPVAADPTSPTPAELRTLAFHTQFNGLSALNTANGLGPFSTTGLPVVPGTEIMTLRPLPDQNHSARALLQIPAGFDPEKPCLVVALASGSRGVYGAVPLVAPWALPKGCAIAYSDKGAGTDYYDHATQTGVRLNGQRAARAEHDLAFIPAQPSVDDPLIATAHAHSQINVEAYWGDMTLDAARWAIGELDARFDKLDGSGMTVIAAGLSNGGNAVLRALEADEDGLLDAVVSIMPNITPPKAPHLYDYAAVAALYQPCLLGDTEFTLGLPFGNPLLIGAGRNRCQSLADAGLLDSASPAAARAVLLEFGFDDDSLIFSPGNLALDLWRAVLANYASAYLETPADAMPCGYRFEAPDASPADKQSWWASASGSPPGGGVVLVEDRIVADSADPHFPGLQCLAELRNDASLQRALAATRAEARWPHAIPVMIAHGQHDALIPEVFSSGAYVAEARANGMAVDYREVPGAQHFDAFLNVLPGDHDWVPILPEAWAALDRAWAALHDEAPLP